MNLTDFAHTIFVLAEIALIMAASARLKTYLKHKLP